MKCAIYFYLVSGKVVTWRGTREEADILMEQIYAANWDKPVRIKNTIINLRNIEQIVQEKLK